METYLTEMARYLAGQSWQIAVLTLAVAVVTFVLRHRSAHVRYLEFLTQQHRLPVFDPAHPDPDYEFHQPPL